MFMLPGILDAEDILLLILFRCVHWGEADLNCVPHMFAVHGDGCGKRHRIDVGIGPGSPIDNTLGADRSPRDTESCLVGLGEVQSWRVEQEALTKQMNSEVGIRLWYPNTNELRLDAEGKVHRRNRACDLDLQAAMTGEVLRSKKPLLPNRLVDILQQLLLYRVPLVGRANHAYKVGEGSG